MNKEYLLRGLDCANCASKIENGLKSSDFIKSVTVSFMTTTLKLQTVDGYKGNINEAVEKVVHKYEPDIVVVDKSSEADHDDHGHTHGEGDGKRQLLMLIVGAVIFATSILLERYTSLNGYLVSAAFVLGYLVLGGGVVLKALRNIAKGQIFDENFLMSVATIGAFLIGDFAEAVAVMLFYQVGEYFQDSAVRRSKKSIADLMDIRPDFAHLKVNGALQKVSPEQVQIGDVIVVKPGEKIPLDGVIIEGESMLDTMALTGESVPRKASVSDDVLSGCINQTGVLTIEVTKSFGESTVAKIIDLVENASSKKAPTENFITTFSRYYTPIVVGLATLLAVIPPLLMNGSWAEWIQRGLIFLVISCPCALVISIPLGFFGGIGGASKRGVLVKGSNYLEALNNLDTVVFDKTGTLTKGVFKVTDLQPANGHDSAVLLETAAYAEVFSNHPIAQSIVKAYGKEIDKTHVVEYQEISGHGISVNVEGKKVLAGNAKLMNAEEVEFHETDRVGTKIYVAKDGLFVGSIVISDEIKEDSKAAIAELKARGVRKAVMLTGDNAEIAHAIAAELHLDEVHAGLLPDQKVEQVERLSAERQGKGKLAFVGDGINDAPVLARADVGIAMGGLGSDAAIEAADVVLMTDEPSKLSAAIDIAKFTRRIVWQNIAFALAVKGVFLALGAFGIASMWEAVFADVGVSVLAILNAMRVLKK